MHIRITFSSSYYKYIYSSDIPKYYYIFRERKKMIMLINNEIILLNGVNFNFIAQTTHKNA